VDYCFADLVEVAVGVCFFAPGCGVGFFVEDSILVAINCRIEACVECLVSRRIGDKGALTGSEYVLVVLCKHTIRYDIPVIGSLSGVDVDH
jgi:hypothetical protein